jgi:hypothetical protein
VKTISVFQKSTTEKTIIIHERREEAGDAIQLELFTDDIDSLKSMALEIANKQSGPFPFSRIRELLPSAPAHYNRYGAIGKHLLKNGYKKTFILSKSPIRSRNGSTEIWYDRC